MNFIVTMIFIYLFLFLTGIGIFRLLTPPLFQQPVFIVFLVPVLGFLQLSIISVYVIEANKSVIISALISSIIALITLYSALKFRRKEFADDLHIIKKDKVQIITLCIFVLVLLLIIMHPVKQGGYLTTPYRIGIDQVGYSETAQFLLQGGTLKSTNEDIKFQLNTDDSMFAKQNNAQALKYNAYIDSEFLLKALRWGYSSVLANLTFLTHHQNVLQIEFIALVFSYALLFILSLYAIHVDVDMPYWLSVISSTALLLNCNMLNTYYEGQSAQIIGMPLLLILMIVFLALRKNQTLHKLSFADIIRDTNDQRMMLFAAVISAGILSIYNELIFSFIVFLVLIFILDIALTRKVHINSAVFMVTSIGLGFIIVLPVSLKWLQFIVAHLQNISIAGWWQPQWAFPSEILGLVDIYADNTVKGTKQLPRNDWSFVLNSVLSELIIAVILVYIIRGKDVDKSFWLSSPMFVLMVFVKNKYIEHIHNYQYMKAYTIFLPVLFGLFVRAIHYSTKARSQLLQYVVKTSAVAVLVMISITGVLYIKKYTHERRLVSQDMFALSTFDKEANLNSYAVITNNVGMDEYMLAPIIPLNWLNPNSTRTSPFVGPHLNKKVIYIVNKKYLPHGSSDMRNDNEYVMYENPSYIIYDTRESVGTLCDSKSNNCDLQVILKKFQTLSDSRIK